MELNFATL